MPGLIDTHCHLDVADFDRDRDAVWHRCGELGLRAILIPAIQAATWPGLLDCCARSEEGAPHLYPALGLHPVYLDLHRDAHLAALERAVAHSRLAAIGEIGLDFFVEDLDQERQLRLFEAQLGIARDAALPVVLHVRKAHDQVLAALRRTPVIGGIAHAFSGSLEQGRQYLDLGFALGFGGMLTFERSTKLRRLARLLPLEWIVLETDAPDLTVASHRGERNSPEYLPEVLESLAAIRELDPSEVASATTANACRVLGIHPASPIQFLDQSLRGSATWH